MTRSPRGKTADVSGGSIVKNLSKLFRDEAGATAIEYGLIAALIAVAAITAMQGLGNQLQTTFNTTSSAMAGANAS